MTRLSLIFLSISVAGVIGLAPQKETGAAFQPAPVKTRSLSTLSVKPALPRPAPCKVGFSSQSICNGQLPGSMGPRG